VLSTTMTKSEYSSCLSVRLSFRLEQSTPTPLICWEIDIGTFKNVSIYSKFCYNGTKIAQTVPEYLRKFGPMIVLFIKRSMVTWLKRLQFTLWSLKLPMFQWLL
jgi:hypothetical protein